VKTFTFFYNRYENASTSISLSDYEIPHYVLVHGEEDNRLFLDGGRYGNSCESVFVTGNPKGLAYQRNSALSMMDHGEWACFMCDDFKSIKAYDEDIIVNGPKRLPITFANQSEYRLRKVRSLRWLYDLFPHFISLAEQHGIQLIGFGLHDNPMNLSKCYTTRGLADGRMWLVKKDSFRFDIKAQLIDDVAWTAENLVRNGNVLVCNWIVPYFERYTSGGFGTKSERVDLRKRECTYLAGKYDPIVRLAIKPGWPEGTHLRIYASNGNIKKANDRLRTSSRP
jgi:hypothetical protein